jgi:uncharacterized membrane protein YdcZ (DUF606 family)
VVGAVLTLAGLGVVVLVVIGLARGAQRKPSKIRSNAWWVIPGLVGCGLIMVTVGNWNRDTTLTRQIEVGIIAGFFFLVWRVRDWCNEGL